MSRIAAGEEGLWDYGDEYWEAASIDMKVLLQERFVHAWQQQKERNWRSQLDAVMGDLAAANVRLSVATHAAHVTRSAP